MTNSASNWIDDHVAALATRLNPTSHLYFEIETQRPQDDGPAHPNVRKIIGTISEAELLAVLYAQLPDILELTRHVNKFVLPATWDRGEGRWKPCFEWEDLWSAQSGEEDPAEISVALFFPGADKQIFGLVVCGVANSVSKEEMAWFHSEAVRILVYARQRDDQQSYASLTNQERNCLKWCASGKTSHEIAKILDLSEHTVNHYFAIVADKLNASSRSHAVVKAIKLGIIDLQECN